MRWPLRYQILVPFAGVILASIACVSLLNAYLATRQVEQQINTKLREVARTLSDSTFPLSDKVLRQMRGLSGAEFVLVDPSGELIAGTLADSNTIFPAAPARAWNEFTLGPPIDAAGHRYFHGAIRTGSQRAGYDSEVLHMLYPEQVWREARWQAIYPPMIVGAAALVAAGLLAAGIASRLSRPILQLRAQVGQLVGGSFQPVTLPPRNDELRDLVESVNALASQLDELHRIIQRSERLAILGQLSGGLAHHLRNDVTGAKMAVQLHQRQCAHTDRDSLEVALRQLVLCEQHVQQFLAIGQPQRPRRTFCRLGDVIQEVIALVQPACRHRKVDLRIQGSGSDATALCSSPLSADPDQLRQLILNLLLNAMEAAGSGGWIRIECAQDDTGEFLVRVSDSGPGPSAAVAERLFEPFVTDKPEGIGLGLALSRQIAEAHDGTLRFSSETGSCFELRLPSHAQADYRPEPREALCS